MYEQLLLSSEVILSAYPLLIKLVDASVTLQVGLRMFVYTFLAFVLSFLTGSPLDWNHILSKETLLTGLLNLVHVAGSYIGFESLTAGNAMSLFYTYPVFNIIGAALAFQEKIPLSSLPWIGVAMIGALLLAQPTASDWTLVGVIGALVAALTETGIYLWFRSKGDTEKEDTQPWSKMFQMYGGSGLLWIGYIILAVAFGFLGKKVFSITRSGLSTVLLFNTLVGFLGYALRFFIIPKVSTITFSALSFFGIVSAYLLGWLFMGETANYTQIAGAVAIIISNYFLVTKETV